MNTIYDYIIEQEERFKEEIPMEDGWFWNFKDHVRRSFLYKHSQFEKNNEDRDRRPFKNIILPVLNVAYRTEGFDVKHIEIYVDNPDTYYKSFLVKKYHDKWALENSIDTFIDSVVESFVDYGGVLVRKTRSAKPEVVDLRTIGFCDQTDLMSGPFAIKHYMTASQLRDMEKAGWGEIGATISIDAVILKAEAKKMNKDTPETKTPGKYIEAYEIHNVAPRDFDYTSDDDTPMVYICCFYTDEQGMLHGVTLFSNREPELPFKFLKRDPIQGRSLGWGGIEELFEPQMWTNFAEVHIAAMLEHASKVYYKSTDPKFKNQNLSQSEMGRVFDIQPNTDLQQIDNVPRNLNSFENYTTRMNEHANTLGGASDLFLGEQPTAGTPFKSVESQLVEGKSLHIWRQGRIATFMDEIYRDWVIPKLGKDIARGAKFMSELSGDEMIAISEQMSVKYANDKAKTAMMEGKLPTRQDYEEFKQMAVENFVRAGNKRFIEILKDEMSEENLDVRTNIAGKQKDLSLMTDKVVNLVRQFLATPQLRQDPEMIKMLNSILETSGLSPIAYSPRQLPAQQQGAGGTEGLKDFSNAQPATV